jgi:uncharacterized membrane protein YphA (DoxX/SURF4 family)
MSALASIFWGTDKASGWRRSASLVCAWLTAALFALAGVWKMTEIPKVTQMFEQLLIPPQLSLATVIAVAGIETAVALLLLIPSTRRAGAWAASGMLVAFMIYMAVNYSRLQGADCSCFPWVKRTVGPVFFWSDAAMLAVSLVAGWWADRLGAWRRTAAVTVGCLLLAVAAWGVSELLQSGVKAPDSIQAQGRTLTLSSVKSFLYFFDPECMHCFEAAQEMGRWDWGTTQVIAIPTREPRFGQEFLDRTQFRASLSQDLEKLQATFQFASGPYAVALNRGRQQLAITHFDAEAKEKLAELGFVKR